MKMIKCPWWPLRNNRAVFTVQPSSWSLACLSHVSILVHLFSFSSVQAIYIKGYWTVVMLDCPTAAVVLYAHSGFCSCGGHWTGRNGRVKEYKQEWSQGCKSRNVGENGCFKLFLLWWNVCQVLWYFWQQICIVLNLRFWATFWVMLAIFLHFYNIFWWFLEII